MNLKGMFEDMVFDCIQEVAYTDVEYSEQQDIESRSNYREKLSKLGYDHSQYTDLEMDACKDCIMQQIPKKGSI